MMEDPCVFHRQVSEEIKEMRQKQEARHCLTHEVKLSYLEKSDEDQWAAINQLRRLVYSGIGIVGASSFFGAIIGNLLAGFYKR
jgi:hypothetical protein